MQWRTELRGWLIIQRLMINVVISKMAWIDLERGINIRISNSGDELGILTECSSDAERSRFLRFVTETQLIDSLDTEDVRFSCGQTTNHKSEESHTESFFGALPLSFKTCIRSFVQTYFPVKGLCEAAVPPSCHWLRCRVQQVASPLQRHNQVQSHRFKCNVNRSRSSRLWAWLLSAQRL